MNVYTGGVELRHHLVIEVLFVERCAIYRADHCGSQQDQRRDETQEPANDLSEQASVFSCLLSRRARAQRLVFASISARDVINPFTEIGKLLMCQAGVIKLFGSVFFFLVSSCSIAF